jgi:CheY-like chemotaxis protein
MKILAVDDDDIALGILDAVLRQADYPDITTASSAEAALARIADAAGPFDCFLLDIEMPGRNGIELCRLIRDMPGYAHAPVIMITAVTDQACLAQAIEAGATDYVNKPFDGLELGARLRAASILSQVLKSNPIRIAPERPQRPARDGWLRLEDPLILSPGPGITGLDQLREGLLHLPTAPYAMKVFAVAIQDVGAIFDICPPERFRGFLEEAAARIIGCFEPERLNLAYAGEGIFAVVLHKARHRGETGIRDNIREAMETAPFASLPGRTAPVRAEMSEVGENRVWTGVEAALAISEACRRARQGHFYLTDEERLAALRDTGDPADAEKLWMVRLLRGLDGVWSWRATPEQG